MIDFRLQYRIPSFWLISGYSIGSLVFDCLNADFILIISGIGYVNLRTCCLITTVFGLQWQWCNKQSNNFQISITIITWQLPVDMNKALTVANFYPDQWNVISSYYNYETDIDLALCGFLLTSLNINHLPSNYSQLCILPC